MPSSELTAPGILNLPVTSKTKIVLNQKSGEYFKTGDIILFNKTSSNNPVHIIARAYCDGEYCKTPMWNSVNSNEEDKLIFMIIKTVLNISDNMFEE